MSIQSENPDIMTHIYHTADLKEVKSKKIRDYYVISAENTFTIYTVDATTTYAATLHYYYNY